MFALQSPQVQPLTHLAHQGMCMAQVGKFAPPFSGTAVVDGHFKQVSLSAYNEAKHWLILVFFPRAWSFICPTEIRAFSSRLDEFVYARACGVVFASTDSEHVLKAWDAAELSAGGLGGVHVPLLSDSSHALSRGYGVLVEDEGVAQRALFIIDPKGVVRHITVNDTDVGRSVDEALRVLDALVFKDQFGEGCPVDWKKGDKGIDVASRNRVEGILELVRKPSLGESKAPAERSAEGRGSISAWPVGWSRPKFGRKRSNGSTVSVPAPAGASTSGPPPSRYGSVSQPDGEMDDKVDGEVIVPDRTITISPPTPASIEASSIDPVM